MGRSNHIKKLIILILISLSVAIIGKSTTQKTLTFGVHPYLPYSELERRFTPLVEYLSAETGYNIVLRIGMNYSEHIASIASETVDIAYLGPAEYIAITQAYGSRPLLAIIETDHTIYFTGHIIASTNNSVSDVSNLNLSEIAFVDPHSTMGYMIPLWMILQKQPKITNLPKLNFLGDHKNVAIGVLVGDYQAGAVKEEVFNTFKDKGLRSIASTPGIPEHCFVTQSSLSPETITALRQSFYLLGKSDSGLQVLQKIKQNITGILAVEDDQFDELRVMLNQLDALEVKN